MNEEKKDISSEIEENSSENTELAVVPDWQTRHHEREALREEIRQRVRNTNGDKAYFRPAKPKPTISDETDKRVGVYARVSTSSTEQTSSIENQTKYYEKKIAENPHWELQEIYSDEGKSGTSLKRRDEFNRMMQDAYHEKFDIILCASVSRFARNMSDCIEQISRLKTMHPSHPIGVYFETENIFTLDDTSEQSLHIHAMLADWESANKSRRMILSYDQRILTGQYPVADLLGYRHTKDGELIIHEEEAKTVRYIFLAYISGHDYDEIAEFLTDKQRPTLKGRVDWNAGMVRNIMTNERRWGDLEARKTIVVDYKHGIVVKNNEQRDSAYVPGHHEGIVTPDMARAARLISASSRNMEGGVPEISVIDQGILKGFVSVPPGWGGVDRDSFLKMCMSVYSDDEVAELERAAGIRRGEQHSNVLSMALNGYQVMPGVFFMNRSTASMTVTRRGFKFNKAAHTRMGNCRFVEVIYHPIYQAIIIRESDENAQNNFCWQTEEGKQINTMSAKAFAQAIYDSLQWIPDYQFKFRGTLKERGNTRFLIFHLDEPQILVGKKKKIEAETEEKSSVAYIPYKIEETENSKTKKNKTVPNISCAYPKEWSERCVGFTYEMRMRRDDMINRISENDVMQTGITVENPLVGTIPCREDILSELEELVMTM